MATMKTDDDKDKAPAQEPAAPPVTAQAATAAKDEFKRPEALYFVGERLPSGEPVEHLAGYGVDARDFERGDPMLSRLSDDQLKLALDSKLYRRTKPDSSKE